MTRTQIQLPDALYRRAKTFSEEREISLAEMTRRGLEMFLARFPAHAPSPEDWQMPKITSGGVKVGLEQVQDVLVEDDGQRSLF